MDFFLVGFMLWGLIAISALLLISGLWKKSWKAIVVSGITILVPSLIFASAQGWIRLLVLLPLLCFVLAYYLKKKDERSS